MAIGQGDLSTRAVEILARYEQCVRFGHVQPSFDMLPVRRQSTGQSEVIFLGYRDSGIDGTPENDNPHASINALADEVMSQLVGIIRRVRPDVVVMFEPSDGYGHPDHITAHRHAVAAFHAAADLARYPEQGDGWQASHLFNTAIPWLQHRHHG